MSDPSDAIFAVCQDWELLTNANGPLAWARILTRLHDSISDLATYHPEYNERTGLIEGIYEDE